jgi:hypothetical protein
VLHDEVAKLCQLLEKSTNVPTDLVGIFNVSILNALWSIITGEKLELGSILQNSISAQKFLDKFSTSNCGQILNQKQPIGINFCEF